MSESLVKNRSLLIASCILCLMLLVIYFNQSQEDPGANHRTTDRENAASPRIHARADGKTHSSAMEETLTEAASPSSHQTFSSSVNVSIEAGETLVMGGYQREDGMHEFTMLTPTLVTLENGRQAIRLDSKAIALNPDLAYQSGLNTLTTRYPTADDHAEAWTQQKVRAIVLSASKATGSGLMSAPSIIGVPGNPFSLKLGGAHGISEYSIEATVSSNGEGGFSIQSRVERNSKSHFKAAAD